jgi:hypothetical protein
MEVAVFVMEAMRLMGRNHFKLIGEVC